MVVTMMMMTEGGDGDDVSHLGRREGPQHVGKVVRCRWRHGGGAAVAVGVACRCRYQPLEDKVKKGWVEFLFRRQAPHELREDVVQAAAAARAVVE